MESLGAFVPLVLIIGVFWLVILRPARRRQREYAEVQASAGVGSRIMTASGIFGEIVGESDERFQLEIAPGVVIEVHRQSVGKVFHDEEDHDHAHDHDDDHRHEDHEH